MNFITKNMKFAAICVFIVTFAQIASAQKGGASRSSGGWFSTGLMAFGGTGKMGNGATDAPDRDMLYTPVGVFLSLNIKKIRLGVNYEYMIAGQTTEPAEVGNTNTSGKGSNMGARIEFYDGKQSFGVVYGLSNEFTLDKATAANTSAKYKGSGSLSVQYTRQIRNKLGFVIDYTTGEYKESLPTANIKWNRIGLGIIITNFTASSGGKR